MRWPRLMSLVVVLLAAAARGDTVVPPPTARVAALVAQLGDARFAQREAAGRALEAVGEPALPALKAAAAGSPDLEVRRRAGQLVRAIMLGARISKSLGLETVLIDPGQFLMGSPTNETYRRPDEHQHRVRITKPFLLGAYEVTQDEYQQVMKVNPSWFAPTGGGKSRVAGLDTGRFPVEMVTWFDAVEFCNRLSRQDGYEPYYTLADVKRAADAVVEARVTITGGNGYRLPTEAEWEFACRAWTTGRFHFGTTTTGSEANFKAILSTGYGSTTERPSPGRTVAVGRYKPNGRGLHDMHGNVGEWCQDWYDKDYYHASPADDPPGPQRGDHRVVRGGSWILIEGSCRSASRFWHTPDERKETTGFRVARTP